MRVANISEFAASREDMMRIFLRFFVAATISALIFPVAVHARCAPELVNAPRAFRAVPVKSAPPARISIEWFGHSFFRLVSPGLCMSNY